MEDILNFENRYRRKDGSYRWIEWHSKPHGEMIYAVARDITERKQIEESLKKANRQLNLLGSITRHDINNKLAVIIGYLEIAGEEARHPRCWSLLTKSNSRRTPSAPRSNLQNCTRILAPKSPVAEVESVVPYSQVPSTIRFVAEVPGEIFADMMLEKVFFNLLDNSLSMVSM